MMIFSVSCGLSAALVVTGRRRSVPVGTGDYRSGTGINRHRLAPTGTGTCRHRPALTGLDRHKTCTDQPGLFYDVFDKNFQNIIPFLAI
jgi:hypothetical protein